MLEQTLFSERQDLNSVKITPPVLCYPSSPVKVLSPHGCFPPLWLVTPPGLLTPPPVVTRPIDVTPIWLVTAPWMLPPLRLAAPLGLCGQICRFFFSWPSLAKICLCQNELAVEGLKLVGCEIRLIPAEVGATRQSCPKHHKCHSNVNRSQKAFHAALISCKKGQRGGSHNLQAISLITWSKETETVPVKWSIVNGAGVSSS